MKLSDPGATAIIGAAAALAGVLLSSVVTLLIDSRRRNWEDARRWDDARRRAYANFLYAARNAYSTADRGLEANVQATEFAQRLEPGGKEQAAPSQIAEAQALTARFERLSSEIDEWRDRLREAAAEIYLIASRRVQEMVDAQVEVLGKMLAEVPDSKSDRDSWTEDQVRQRRTEFHQRWWKASEDFRQAVAEELRVEPRRWWQVWKR